MAVEADVERLYSEAVEKLGGIDVAVLNAGVGRHGNVEDVSVQDFDLQFNTNVRGVFLWLKHILPHMKVGKQILCPNPNSQLHLLYVFPHVSERALSTMVGFLGRIQVFGVW